MFKQAHSLLLVVEVPQLEALLLTQVLQSLCLLDELHTAVLDLFDLVVEVALFLLFDVHRLLVFAELLLL